MDRSKWSHRDGQYPGRLHQQKAAKIQATVTKALPATVQSPSDTDYRIHMMLSALMLLAGLVIANLQ